MVLTSNRPDRPDPRLVVPAAAAPATPALGPHTGPPLVQLPVEDLSKPGLGAWNGDASWKQSSVAAFQGQPALRMFFKEGSGTSAHPHHDASGVQIRSAARGLVGTTAAVVAFDIFFDPARWAWSGGGKIGGVFVGEGAASGGRHTADGASHRIMWQKDGGAISYLYLPRGVPQPNPALQKCTDYGLGLHHQTFARALKTGQWNRVELGIKLNSFVDGKPAGDGKAVLTINGVTAVTEGVNWARAPGLLLTGLDLNAFFGGPDPAVVDSLAFIRNVAVHAWRD
jgi:hypothetical protein